MSFALPKLPYDPAALEPVISARTIEFHYGKHHQAYVNNLNNLVPGTPYENATLEEIIGKAEGPVFNNAAQVWNHTFYWEGFSPERNTTPKGLILKKFEQDFGSFDEFKTKFSDAAVKLFGSGWVWLVMNAEGKLSIVQTGNAGNPLRDGLKPLLTCDVWEHAYYLDYQNRRPDYIAAFWSLVDWGVVGSRV